MATKEQTRKGGRVNQFLKPFKNNILRFTLLLACGLLLNCRGSGDSAVGGGNSTGGGTTPGGGSPVVGTPTHCQDLGGVLSPPRTGKQYFVSTKGNDKGAGTLEDPFLTIAYGIEKLGPGDTLNIRGGRYHEQIAKRGLHGAADNPIIIQAYQCETVTLDGTKSIADISLGRWERHQGNIYKIQLREDVWQLFDEGATQTSARWPNAFWHDGSIWDIGNFASFAPGSIVSFAGGPPENRWIDASLHTVPHDLSASGIDATGAMAILNIADFDTYAERVIQHTPGAKRMKLTWNGAQTIRHELDYESVDDVAKTGVLTKHYKFYFLEAALSLLDAPTEWFYEKDSKTLYFYAKDGGDPTGRNIRGKVQSYFLEFADSSYVMLRGLGFFGTTFSFIDKPHHVTIENCDALYPSYSKRMLGSQLAPDITRIAHGEGNRSKTVWSPTYNTIRNSTFRCADGAGIMMKGRFNRIENCLFHQIDYAVISPASGGGEVEETFRGDDDTLTVRQSPSIQIHRVTVDTAGSAHNIPGGSQKATENNGEDSSTASYSRVFRGGLLQAQDGANFHVWQFDSDNSVFHHNWAHGTTKFGFRVDGTYAPHIDNPKLPFNTRNNHCGINYNVAWDMMKLNSWNGVGRGIAASASIRVGGDYHNMAHNIALDGFPSRADFRIESRDGGNTRSLVKNNLATSIGGGVEIVVDGQVVERDGFNGIKAANLFSSDATKKLDLRKYLRDPANLDFRPVAGSELIDKGESVAGITTDVVGGAPDIGAYEFGAKTYWIPGYQSFGASTPIPPDGATHAKANLDLMWLPGYQAKKHSVYFGVDSSLKHLGDFEGDNNICPPGIALVRGKTYYWRVDTIDRYSRLITGPLWTFTVEP